MKQREFTKIAKQLLPQFPQLAADRKLIFPSRIKDVLCGLAISSAIDANVFYVYQFLLPLYVPTETFHVTFAKRLKINGNQGWRTDDPHLVENLSNLIHQDVMPFIDKVFTLAGCLDYLKADIESGRPRVNSHELEALAYTFIKCGDYPAALASLAELKQMLKGNTVPWVVAQFNRAQLVEQKLLQSSEEALAQLKIWKVETIRNLKLEEFC